MKNLTLLLLFIFLINCFGCTTFGPNYRSYNDASRRNANEAMRSSRNFCKSMYHKKEEQKSCFNATTEETLTIKIKEE